jgi:DNA-binding transcriptional regulator YdaS (Cro superfamily)
MLQEVVEWFGSQANLARALHVDRAAVSHWVARGWLPPKRAVELEKLSGGKFKAVDLTKTKD